MKSRQVLDAFSETLISDERILSVRERELITALLQNAKAASSGNAETHKAVMAVIGRSVGETVAQRAFTLLGDSIVRQIVSRGLGSIQTTPDKQSRSWSASISAGPQPPTPTPSEPAEPREEPAGPQPSGPQPPTMSIKRRVYAQDREATRSAVGILDPTDRRQGRCVVLQEFLAPQELNELIRYTLRHEQDFRSSEVVSPTGEIGVADYSHRRSHVLMDLGPYEKVILQRIRHVLPRVLEQLGMEEFPIMRTEAQITASNDGDFFRAHCDDAQELVSSRQLTFVYFFHREPVQFTGGELRLHDSPNPESPNNDKHSATGSYEAIVPEQNQIVFFPCSTLHEITAVHCSSGAFADGRFTVNGWLHR